jgi:CHAT domain-containing protein
VLSACQTGRGKVTGDGVLGMTRAFFAAGAATVIASVWDVPDAPTEQLMVSFYRGLQRGLSKSEAMRQAQLALIHRLREKKVTIATAAGSFTLPENPQFWAGFVLEGNP